MSVSAVRVWEGEGVTPVSMDTTTTHKLTAAHVSSEERERDHFNPIPTACGCGEGAVNTSCSSEGLCYCQPGVGRAKCDLCRPFTFNLSTSGCESCGECELGLRDDLERENEALVAIAAQEQLVLQLSEVDRRGLGEVGGVASELAGDLEEVGERLDQIESETDSVNASYTASQETISTIQQRVSENVFT